MWINVKIKAEKENTPYRVFINDELITERLYTVPHGALAPIEGKPSGINFEDISNILHLEIVDADNYDVRIENIPGGPQEKVWMEEVKWQEESYAN